jgi:hypothetical protein
MRSTQVTPGLLANVDKVVSGPILDWGPDHLTVKDMASGDEISVRLDDTTRFRWTSRKLEGQLTDSAQIRVGYQLAGGVHVAREVIVLDPGKGASIAGLIGAILH